MSSALQSFRPESLCLLKESREIYWRYPRQNPEDISVYTEKSSIYDIPIKRKFKEGSDVLVRWTDGLLYLGNIIEVEDEYSRCAIKFEDGSQYWALFKDIHKGPTLGGDIVCTVCDSGASQPPDEIVICDKCTLGYHQLCHVPHIDSSVLRPDVHWCCRKCIFAFATKKGGALKKGPHAQAMQAVKHILPYEHQSLTWDIPHRSNLQQTYCYCGGPGEWYMKMLQCSRCKQWFHEACLQCLEEPLLFGDRFFIFVCSVCNQGPEFLRRLALRWPDIAHLVLFNLTVQLGKKYFDLDSAIMTFLIDNWLQFQIQGELSCCTVEEKKTKMLETLQNNKSRFKSGKEVKRKTALWGLRARVPPPIPAIILPESGPINDKVLNSFKSTGRKSKFVIKADSIPVPLKRNRKKLFENTSFSSSPTSKCTLQDDNEMKGKEKCMKSSKGLQYGLRNSVRKFSNSSMSFSEISESEDTSSSQGTLNSIIPPPNDFDGINHPFRCNEKPHSCKSQSSSVSNQTQSSSSTSAFKKITRRRYRKHVHSSSKTHSFLNQLIDHCDSSAGNIQQILVGKTPDLSSTSSKTNLNNLNTSLNNYFGAADRIASGEKYNVLAKRIAIDGETQYLLEWEGVPS